MIKKFKEINYFQELAREISKYTIYVDEDIYDCICRFKSVDIVIDATILACERNRLLSEICKELHYEQNKR